MVSTDTITQSEKGGGAALDSMTGSAATSPLRNKRNNAVTKAQQLQRFRSHRWKSREVNRRNLRGTRCASCGRPVSKQTGVGLYYDVKHKARFSGLMACGNVNCCPVCNAKIMAERSNEIRQALESAKKNGYGVVFGTLTLRHDLKNDLGDLRRKLLLVWRNLNKQRSFVKLLDEYGEFGFVRAQEATVSNVNGWHPHLHVFYFFDHELSVIECERFGARFAQLWINTVERMNRKHKEATASGLASPFIDGIGRPLPKNQIFKVVHLNKSSIDKYSKYVTTRKSVALPGEDVISRMSADLTSTQTKIGKVKQHDDGRKVLHMNYWDMLEALRVIGTSEKPIKTVMSEKLQQFSTDALFCT